jgi:putative mRNA 3-end processing factor
MGRKAAVKQSSIVVKQTDDGLHLSDSILWFDSQLSGDLSFLSSASSNYLPKVPQVIATEETVKILEACRKKPNALVCQYNRPFSIGRLKMELLPSGCVLGGASLYVETDNGRLLYAPQLQPNRIPTVRQMQLKRASTLILGVNSPDPHAASPNRKKEKERLVETVKKHLADDVCPLIVAEPVAIAQEITKLLCDAEVPVAVHEAIFKVNKVYEAFGSMLGDYAKYSPKHTQKRVVLFPRGKKGYFPPRPDTLRGPVLFIDEANPGPDRFVISPSCDGPEIKEIVQAVNPKELYIFGPYAKRYVEELEGVCPVIKPLFINDQPTLF